MSPAVLPEATREGLAAARELARHVAGTVTAAPLARWLYSTDASIYRVVPDAVLVAASVDDLAAAAVVAGDYGVPLCMRGAATSLAGQTLGPGIAVDCFHLDGIVSIDPDARTAVVDPGVIQASLNRAAAPWGLEFGPDTSTVDQATIGGMAGNNSSGSRSIVYGETKDKLLRVHGILAGGETAAFGPSRGDDLATGIEGACGRRLAAGLAAMRSRARDRIAADFPQTSRRVSGYNLPELLQPQPNLARLLAGSEGTLALFARLTVQLDEVPETRPLAALTFPSLRAALEANLAILGTGPSAVELIDLAPLRGSPNLRRFTRLAAVLDGDDPCVLLVEYQGSVDETQAGLARLRGLEPELGATLALSFADPAEVAEAWQLRRAALPLLMGAPGVERPASFVEDTAVPVERLADFVDDFQQVVAGHGARASFTGHTSAGCMHVRPLLDLKTADGVDRLKAIGLAVGRLVKEYHGALSGEHGDGLSRSWFNPELFGPETYAELVALKDLFDPRRLLGPGRVVEAPPIDDHLRFGAGYADRSRWAPRLDYAGESGRGGAGGEGGEGGFALAAERCFGAGLCKKLTGSMCPTAMVGRDETLTTRARANALQAIVAGAVPLAALGAEEFEEVMGTCLACKACKAECPAAVDVAALKAEWQAEVNAREGTPLLSRAVADVRLLSRLAAPVAPAVNALGRGPLARALLPLAGVDRRRSLPSFTARPLSRRARATGSRADADVVLVADCFIEHNEPHVGEAAVRLLEAAGHRVAVVDAGCCGRTALSVGMIDKARRRARRMAGALAGDARAGRAIAFVEPSCLAMVADDWQRLLPGDAAAEAVRAAARPALSLVADAAAAGRLSFESGGEALLHPHCHERAVFGPDESERALRAVDGLDLRVLDHGCCGMSGFFGYKKARYELSVAVAERALLPAVRAAGPGVAVLATGTSCRSQIGDLAAHRPLHPLEFLAGRLVT